MFQLDKLCNKIRSKSLSFDYCNKIVRKLLIKQVQGVENVVTVFYNEQQHHAYWYIPWLLIERMCPDCIMIDPANSLGNNGIHIWRYEKVQLFQCKYKYASSYQYNICILTDLKHAEFLTTLHGQI